MAKIAIAKGTLIVVIIVAVLVRSEYCWSYDDVIVGPQGPKGETRFRRN